MARELVTGNNAAGYTLALAGEANRKARGAICGAYPITPQTEIVEFLRDFKFTKGRVVAGESEERQPPIPTRHKIPRATNRPDRATTNEEPDPLD